MRRALLALMMATLACNCAGAEEQASGVRITVLGPKSPRPESYLIGEAVILRVEVANLSDNPVKLMYVSKGSLFNPQTGWELHVEGDEVGPRCREVNVRLSPVPPLTTLAPDEDHAMDVSPGRSLGAGHYEVWIEYEQPAARIDYFAGEEGIVKERVVSNRFQFEIVEPKGVDALVLEKFGAGMYCNDILVSHDREQAILEEFPTSTYAGLALLGTRDFAQGVIPPDHANVIGGREDTERWERETRRMETIERAQLERRARYLADRPDFDGADRLLFDIAWIQAYLGERTESRRTLETLLAKNDLPPWLRQLCEKSRDTFQNMAGQSTGETARDGGSR